MEESYESSLSSSSSGSSATLETLTTTRGRPTATLRPLTRTPASQALEGSNESSLSTSSSSSSSAILETSPANREPSTAPIEPVTCTPAAQAYIILTVERGANLDLRAEVHPFAYEDREYAKGVAADIADEHRDIHGVRQTLTTTVPGQPQCYFLWRTTFAGDEEEEEAWKEVSVREIVYIPRFPSYG